MSINLHMTDEEYKRLVDSNVLHLEDHDGNVISDGSNFNKLKHLKKKDISIRLTKEDLEALKKKNLLGVLPFNVKVLNVDEIKNKAKNEVKPNPKAIENATKSLKLRIQELEHKLIQKAGENSKLQRNVRELESSKKTEVSQAKTSTRKNLKEQIESEIIKKYQQEAKREIGKIRAQIRREERKKYHELLREHEDIKKQKSHALRKASRFKNQLESLQEEEDQKPDMLIEEVSKKPIIVENNVDNTKHVIQPQQNNKLFSTVIVAFVIVALVSFGFQEFTGSSVVDDELNSYLAECTVQNPDQCGELFCKYAYYSEINDTKNANMASDEMSTLKCN